MSDLMNDARLALACLDLTSLNDGDSEATTTALCQRARTPFGPVAAVCVWPRFVRQARSSLPAAVRVAAVANFPEGELNLPRALADVQAIADAGGQEVDVVLPYKALMGGGEDTDVAEFLVEVRRACGGLTLKVIIESGALQDDALIRRASRLALSAGADFIKTSTGKTPVSATPEAAAAMLEEIARSGMAHAGFKASGGIRTVAQAAGYIAQARQVLGEAALNPKRLRFGASGLLDDILAVLSGGSSSEKGSGY